jgi:UPF0176 protein
MTILIIAGYKFITLSELPQLRQFFDHICRQLDLRGTILLSEEGININVAGSEVNIGAFREHLHADLRFADMSFHEGYSDSQPFKRLKVRVKQEIITMRQSGVKVTEGRAPCVSPEMLKQWLDEKRDITLLDTRNGFEVDYGTFVGAADFRLKQFGDFPEVANKLERDKPVVMFCTGGVRCEKAAIYLLDQGFSEVYQLDGGILGYFTRVGGSHYQGGCFVFDERSVVNPETY